MKVFKTKNGQIFQLADLEKIKSWNAEMPLLFIGFIKDKRLDEYPKEIRKNVEDYLDEILESVAIPKLVDAISGNNIELRLTVSKNLAALSESNPDQLKIALPHIERVKDDPNKEIAANLQKTLKNYAKAQKRKETAKKRAKLRELRKKMDQIDTDFADGKVTDAAYMKEQKNYLKLKREIELAENVD